MLEEQGLRPKADDAQWTWPKVAIVVITLMAMAILLMVDMER